MARPRDEGPQLLDEEDMRKEARQQLAAATQEAKADELEKRLAGPAYLCDECGWAGDEPARSETDGVIYCTDCGSVAITERRTPARFAEEDGAGAPQLVSAVRSVEDDVVLPPEPLAGDFASEPRAPQLVSALPEIAPVGEVGTTIELSESWVAIAAALIEASKQFGPIERSGYNSYFKSHYSTAADVENATKMPLLEAGILATHGTRPLGYPMVQLYDAETRQTTTRQRARYAVTTVLLHPASAEWMRNTVVIDGKDSGPHAAGSCMQYGMRYNMRALLNLASEDDDGNAATARARQREQGGQDPRRSSPPPAQQQPPAASKGAPVNEAAKIKFAREIDARTVGDTSAARDLVKNCTAFDKSDGSGRFEGYADWRKIVKAYALQEAWKALHAHPVFGDAALGLAAGHLVSEEDGAQ